ncbi:Cell division protein FtsB [Candidatus Desulfarcum epimagneticum]|uniref:Cell division protein FtsB n=1 Tax=uncultured Desulfobacteraceae bacterium TaxID=218296 RepID=A0A484HF36_9BACT|nr:Cell division protein FtsB [uncultured Desulfobacteraceae bacterium]
MKRGILLGVMAAVLGATLILIVFGDNGYMDRNRMKKTLERLALDNKRLADENLDFYRRIHRLKTDPVYVEGVARRELGLAADGEVVFHLHDPGKKPKKPNP